MTPMKRLARPLAVAAALALFATGCGGDDGGGRPSVDEISETIQNGDIIGSDLDASVADCIAEAFRASDLSDEALQAIVDEDEGYDPSDEDAEALSSISTDAATECVAEGTDMPEEPEAS